MPSNSKEYSSKYWHENKERLREAKRERRKQQNARYRPMSTKKIKCSPEAAAVITLLMGAQRKSGVSMPEFVQALRGAASNATWRELSEVYQIWRDTDEGQRLIGDR